jgi:hypothetical protein
MQGVGPSCRSHRAERIDGYLATSTAALAKVCHENDTQEQGADNRDDDSNRGPGAEILLAIVGAGATCATALLAILVTAAENINYAERIRYCCVDGPIGYINHHPSSVDKILQHGSERVSVRAKQGHIAPRYPSHAYDDGDAAIRYAEQHKALLGHLKKRSDLGDDIGREPCEKRHVGRQ